MSNTFLEEKFAKSGVHDRFRLNTDWEVIQTCLFLVLELFFRLAPPILDESAPISADKVSPGTVLPRTSMKDFPATKKIAFYVVHDHASPSFIGI